MRLFIAIELPKEIKDELFKIQKLISPSLAKIKWVSKKNLHLTLKFIGETDVDPTVLVEKLNRVSFKSIKTSLFEFGAFPTISSSKVNILWVNLNPVPALINLQQEVDSELFTMFKKDQMFSPHLTLGRVKLIKKKDKFLNILKKISVKPIEFEINEFKLMQIKLTKDGPVYSIVERFKS